MTESRPSSPGERAALARSLADLLHTGEAALAGALADLLDRTDAMLALKDAHTGRYVRVSPRLAALFGRSADAMVGLADADLVDPAQLGPLRSAEQAAMAQGACVVSEHRLDLKGTRREFNVVRLAITGDGAARHLMAVWVDHTAAREREAQFQLALAQLEQQQVAAEAQRREAHDQALRDTATGLYQGAHFEDQLRREVDLSSREHREFALVSIALDPLSEPARTVEGRTRVLEALGRLLRSNTRAMDASCRLADDRFAVLLSGVGLATAHSRMEGLRRQCATQIVVLDGRNLGFTVSMGVASFPHTAHTQDDLMAASEKALAEARSRGGNHVTLASIRFEI